MYDSNGYITKKHAHGKHMCIISVIGYTSVLETALLLPQYHKSRTVCRPISDYVGWHTASSGSL